MNKRRSIMLLITLLVITAVIFTGCNSQSQNFTFSRDIDNNGYWRGVKALKYVELGNYTGITIPKDRHTVTDEDIQSNIDSLLEEHKVNNNITDRAVEYGDTLNIDYVGRVDEVAFEGGSTGGTGTDVTIGVTEYIDDFLEQLIGHNPGETFDIEVTFPIDYGKEELNGKDAVFTVTINYIVESVLPELTDEFISTTFGESNGWTTVEQMKAALSVQVQNVKISEYIQEYLEDNSTVKEVPEIIIDFQNNAVIRYYQDYADYYEMELDEFLIQYVNVESQEALLEQYKEENEKVARTHLIMQAVAEDAKIKATADDVQAYFTNYMTTEDYSEYEEIYGLNYLKLTALVQMVIDHIQSSAILE
ncbi:MAG: FKBP-type peptidyl-prolyl cis-trans isomerase [Clostridia bacterium]